jgi:AraC-like DNA-binding protein/quercetin dioxygenase-like cupin family protein
MAQPAAAASSHRLGDLSHHLRLPATPPYADLNFFRWESGRTMDWHEHGHLQAIQTLSGTLEVDWGAGWRRLGPGQVHVLPQAARHRLRSHGHEQFGLNFRADADPRGLLALLIGLVPRPMACRYAPPPGCLEALRSCESVDAPADRLAVAHELDRWCLALVTVLTRRDPAAGRLLAFLRAHLDRPLRVPAVAQALGTSRAQAQRLALGAYGTGIAHLQERLRLERAAQLLATTSLRSGEIAIRCGFRDGAHFSRRFSSRYGAAPSVWRKGLG